MTELTFVERNFGGLQKYTWFNVCIKPYRIINFTKKYLRQIISGELSDEVDRYISPDLTKKGKLLVYLDILLSNIRYGASIYNYLTYDFYQKSKRQRKQYITEGQSQKFWYTFNPPKYREIFRDKNQTYKTFEKYFGREVLYLTEDHDFQSFKNFCLRHAEIFLKPKNASYGRGARKLGVDASVNFYDLYKECIKKQLIIEEVIVQHHELAKFHPTSLNTIRLGTVVTKHGVRLMKPSFFKMGNNYSVTDNFRSGGLFSEIDLDTGIVYSCAIDIYKNKHENHPITNHQIKGFQIPNWEEIKNFACELAMVVPQNRYVGWDIALSNNGKPLLIEGNDHASFIALFEPGNRKIFEEALKDI